jgi:hypothetical protein
MVEDIAARRRVGDRRPHPGALLAFRENLEAILATAAGNRIGVVVTNLPTILSTQGNTPEELTKATGVILPRIEHLAMFQGVIDDVCRAHPEIACVTDVFALGETGKGPFFFDDCHPLPEGYAVMARRVFDVLVARPDLLSRTSPTSGRLR